MIHKATPADIPRIVEIGKEFLAVGPYAWVGVDPVAFADFAGRLIEQGVIFLAPDGMIGGCLYPFYFNPAVLSSAELFWYSPKHGRELRQAWEAWIQEKGCVSVTASALVDEREAVTRRLYQRAGYQVAEVSFVKRFAP